MQCMNTLVLDKPISGQNVMVGSRVEWSKLSRRTIQIWVQISGSLSGCVFVLNTEIVLWYFNKR